MSIYKDPDNFKEIEEEIYNLPSVGDTFELINKIYPTWIIGYIDDYSKDYDILKKNWTESCTKTNATPTKIILVEAMFELDYDSHKLIHRFCELLSMCGFLIRTKKQLIACKKCGNALLSEPYYNTANKIHNFDFKWSDKCSYNCN